MEFRQLGRSTLSLSVAGLGCNNFGRPDTGTFTQEGTTAVVDAALASGVTFFDTADIYGAEFGLSERLLGQALVGRRDDVIIASKFGHSGFASPIPGAKGSRAYIRAAIDGSLTRLRTDRIDLFQLHTPDPGTPIEETLDALGELQREGKVIEVGHSNFDVAQTREADAAAETPGRARFESAQNEYSLLARGVERDLLPVLAELGIGFLPYFPLANGLFSGKFSRTDRPADSRIARQRPHIADNAPWDAIEALDVMAVERGITLLEATFGWLLAKPAMTSVIAGATRPEQVRQNAAAATAWHPSADELAAIDALFPIDV